MRSVSFFASVWIRFFDRVAAARRGRRFGATAAVLTCAVLAGVIPAESASPEAGGAMDRPAAEPASRLEALERDLATAESAEAAAPIRRRLVRLRMLSGSPTADLLAGRAALAQASGDGGLALDLLDAAIVVAPNWAGGRHLRGAIHAERGAFAAAVVDLGEALARDPADASALVLLALLRERAGEKKAALDLVRRAVAADPTLPDLDGLRDRLELEVEGQPL